MTTWLPNVTILLPLEGTKLMLIDEPPNPVWDGMTREDFLLFAAHTRWTADRMGLRDWRLQLKWEPADKGEEHGHCWARCEVMGTIKTCNIWVFEGFAHIPRWEAHRAIVHELVHIILDRVVVVGDQSIEKIAGLPFVSLLGEEMNRQVETACEQIAANWGATLPSIPDKLTSEDDVYIRFQDGREMHIGEYLKLPEKAKES